VFDRTERLPTKPGHDEMEKRKLKSNTAEEKTPLRTKNHLAWSP